MKLGKFQKQFKIIGLILGLLFVLGITVFAGKQASTFLAKASSCSVKNVSVKNVSANGAIISWETDDISQGRVEYGTGENLAFSAPEASSGKTHNVSLTLLTPNTIYYYLIAIGDTYCDSAGSKCSKDETCVPWSFTTSAITPQPELTKPLPTNTPTPVVTSAPQAPSPTRVLSLPTSVQSTGSTTLSTDCQQVKNNLGGSSSSSNWSSISQFDIDGNGVINGLDIIRCQQQ